jgi:cyclic beta-1,2-glucan synthetase
MDLFRSKSTRKPNLLLATYAKWKTQSRALPPEPALRAELFSADQMELHGSHLAGLHRLSTGSGSDHLLPRLTNNEAALLNAYERLTKATLGSYRVTPAAEWLLDNYYLIAEQIRIARHHLPKGYSRELPRLANGPSSELPRVYSIALETISHGDGRVNNESLSRFIAAYQTVTPLTLGELWAIPIMLRLALIENLRRVASRVTTDLDDRNLAGQWADRMTETAGRDPKSVVLTVADMARSRPPVASSFVAELARRLQGQSATLALPLTWIEQLLAESGLSIDRMVQMEAQQQAADQVSISNSISSLRLLSSTDWRDFVESASLVEQVLREDPADVYRAMDFATRDRYRHSVERLARASKRPEEIVARAAINLSRDAVKATPVRGVAHHVGFYLLRDGVALLERHLEARVSAIEVWRRILRLAPLPIYLTLAALITFAFAWPFLDAAHRHGWHSGLNALLAVPALLMASRLAIDLVNWSVTLTVQPDWLPRLDFTKGIPAQMRTLVVIPSLIGSAEDIEDLAEGLEVRFLANRDPHLHFGLLSDFMDAATEHLDQDASLMLRAQFAIEALNEKYRDTEGDRFFLFHRPRRWNAVEKVWMAHERKRGKIAELDALLRGEGRDRFSLIVGNIVALPRVRYVITLDTDTQLPRDAARQFIGAISHPLNAAVYDAHKKRVTSGHAILQPRVSVSLTSTARSTYARLFGGDAGIDPYTRAASDVYQDLFREGSFIGKGIYEVDAFEQAVEGRFPDNRILSHDLVEGCYARAALLSDVHLYEEYPSRYSSDVNRRHRWIRGDWQLLPWIFPWAPTQDGGLARNPLSLLSRWKLFDNLRRSAAPAALLAMLLTGWISGWQPAVWTIAIVALSLGMPLSASLIELLQKPHDMPLRRHIALTTQSAGRHLARALLGLAWLPHEALYSMDAIVRTLWRVGYSHRKMLQWNASREVERAATNDPRALYRQMAIGPLLGAASIVLFIRTQETLAAVLPFALAWLVSPLLAWWISRPPVQTESAFAAGETQFLRALARKTWAFFDEYVRADDHWLPPDNIQEMPTTGAMVIARRTSPTNMGMGLLAHLAAFDFGYLSAGRMLARVGETLATMDGLERYRNHFLNWYDTSTLEALGPRYVSTVDSGNLAGHLMTLSRGLLQLADEPAFDRRVFPGLADTLDAYRAAAHDAEFDLDAFLPLSGLLGAASATPPRTLSEAVAVMRQVSVLTDTLVHDIKGGADSDLAFWSRALKAQCLDIAHELDLFDLRAAPDSSAALPTIRQLARLDMSAWHDPSDTRVVEVRNAAVDRIAQAERLAQLAGELATMDFKFLYDRSRELLSIGYNVDERRLDAGFYDLLASEARLTNFVAIAQGQLPQESWFTLGRLLTSTGGVPVLLSWTGSMFEYLMPMLVMPTYDGTLLDQTCRAAVARQIEYGHQLGVSWGVSESGYNVLDAQFNYQYRAFGVPGLGLKRGLGDDVVIAPYATALALMVAPDAACRNLQRLTATGAAGRFGLYEAIDHTQARVPRGQSSVVIQSYMAHHQGMSLLSLASVLLGQPMQRRFESDPQFKATTLLLQERIPKTATEYLPTPGLPSEDSAALIAETKLRIFTDPDRPRPSVQLLSNGRYHVMVSSAGGGYSRCGDLSVTRWREDMTSDNWGMFCYLRDVASGEFWSSAHQPTLRHPDLYEAIFSDARAEFRVRERDFDSHTEIVVSPEDDIELRRVRITNRARVRRTIELTSYGEVVLAPAIADAAHRAFSNLFVQTELLEPLQAILCTRRARSSKEVVPWMCHLLAAHGVDIDAISYETDRARFIGRGRNVAHPAAMDDGSDTQGRLSNSAGSVLDPVVSIRCRITLNPGQSATIDFVTGMSDSRDGCLHLINKYRDRQLADRVFDLAWTHSQVSLRQMNATVSDARLYEQMAASIIYANASLRAESGVLSANRRNQSGLWGQSISGDLPIVLLQITDMANIELVRQMVQAHAYWRLKGLAVDLVIWNEDHAGYRQDLQDLIMGLIASGTEANLIDRPGGIFVRPAQQLSREDRDLMQAVARIIVSDTRGSLAEQVERRRPETSEAPFEPTPGYAEEPSLERHPAEKPRALILQNPYGGFSEDGAEYIIRLQPGQATPAPWSNVLANPGFGSVVSESGGAYTWSENAHEFRLTPWINDPVSDSSGEAFYLRDEETGHHWSPTPLPRRGSGTYTTRHGFGYSVFEHEEEGIRSELWVYVALHASIKFSVLKIRNVSGRARRLSATGYVEWTLGDLREKSAMHIVTEADPLTGTLFARNDYSMEFGGRVGFFAVDEGVSSFTCDRREFIGRNGSLRAPAAMRHARLSGRAGAGLDPCAALKADFDIADGDSHEIVFQMGAAHDAQSVEGLAKAFRGAAAAASALHEVREHWRATLGRVQVKTPEPAVDVLVNGWLMYQVIACRFWARSGYYQSGGAFGFRDQLQDSMAMIHATPQLTRAHLLLCAAHQFPEGDVQHWWHPPLGRGVRTECSDDYLWLAVATSRYVAITGDRSVLDERVGYIEGRAVHVGEDSYYDLPGTSPLVETLYAHCVRAIEHGMTKGAHGLPLIGSGDWNDGMNLVGAQGRGESVWLGFFLYDVLLKFADTALMHGDAGFATRCRSHAVLLRDHLELHGWDGDWYRRAYFDDGTPLGSAANDECKIDSIAQSWSVLSGAGSADRQREAMASLDRYLVKRDAGLIQLLAPPFDRSALDPGYIKGYVPGVRENGGQYTHAAIWATMAFATLGDSERAWELLRMINPVLHGRGGPAITQYKVEPYVMTADVYGVSPHEGRGGWSWYTGSAAWMYRLVVESLLGLSVIGDRLSVAPLLPANWRSFEMTYRYGDTPFRITVNEAAIDSAKHAILDGVPQQGGEVILVDDGREHTVEMGFPRAAQGSAPIVVLEDS